MTFIIGWVDLSAIECKLDLLYNKVKGLQEAMSAELDRLIAAVEAGRTVTASVNAAVVELAAKVRELKDQPEKLLELADELEARNAEVAGKVLENTDVIDSDNPPVEEPPVEEPPVEEPQL